MEKCICAVPDQSLLTAFERHWDLCATSGARILIVGGPSENWMGPSVRQKKIPFISVSALFCGTVDSDSVSL